MSPSRHERLRTLFHTALDLPEQERGEWLRNLTGDDSALRKDLQAMLAADQRAGQFLKGAAMGRGREDALIGRQVGSYRVLELIAHGGMGSVYRASQETPRRDVALKLIRSGFPSEESRRRFAMETEALGRLEHSGIARIHEAGTVTEGGVEHPFFAMEFIQGTPLDEFAEARSSSVSDRCRLLVRVCEAVQYAHQKGVIHRDLKPANILVTPDGEPRVVDFGVARVVDPDNASMVTATGHMVGTPAYMSPEQVSGSPASVDTRSDVYSLGVVAYELLAGRLPYDLRDRSVAATARIIETVEPDRMTHGDRSLDRDLDLVVRTALAKDPNRRYGSAAEFAADLKRVVRREPVAARPASRLYVAGRFVQRNRGLVTAGAVGLALLLAALTSSLLGWSRAVAAREEARQAEARASAVNEFLADMLQAANPWTEGRDVRVVDLLETASQDLESSLGDHPAAAAAAHTNLGTTYNGLGLYPEAERHFRRAVELQQQLSSGAADPDLLLPLRNLGQFLLDDGRVAEAESLETVLEPVLTTLVRSGNPRRAEAWHFLATLRDRQGKFEEAVDLYQRSLAISVTELGPEHPETVTTRSGLGLSLMQLDRLDEARGHLDAALAIRERDLGRDHPSTLITLNNLAFVAQRSGRHDQALDLFTRSLDSRIRVHGESSPSAVVGHHNLALQYGTMGRFEDAVPHHRKAMSIGADILGPDHVRVHVARAAYGGTLAGLDRSDDALAELERAYRGLSSTLGADHWRSQKLAGEIRDLLLAGNRPEDAAAYAPLAAPSSP